MIESILLVGSVIVNIALLFYARWLIKILQVKEEESTTLGELIAEYVSHVSNIHEMEMFYGDQTLKALIDHGKELITNIEEFDYILLEKGEEEGPLDE